MATTCDDIEVDLSRVDVDVSLEQPILNVAWDQADITVRSEQSALSIDLIHPDLIIAGGGIAGAGPPGGPGKNAWTLSTISFVVPDYGNSVTVQVEDTSWVAVGEFVWVANAAGSGQAASLEVTSKTGNSITLYNPVPSSGGINDAPADGTMYGRRNSTWTAIAAGSNVFGESPSGTIDGSNHDFTCANAYTPTLLCVFLNGLRQASTLDYTETGAKTFHLATAPLSGDHLLVDYVMGGEAGGGGGGISYSFSYYDPTNYASGAYTLGVVFSTPAAAATLTKISYFKTSGETGTSRQVGLWKDDGTLLGSQTATDTSFGWNTVTLSTPINLVSGASYRAGYSVSTEGGYSGLTYPVDSGPLTASVGCFLAGPFSFPSSTYGAWYGVNVTVLFSS